LGYIFRSFGEAYFQSISKNLNLCSRAFMKLILIKDGHPNKLWGVEKQKRKINKRVRTGNKFGA